MKRVSAISDRTNLCERWDGYQWWVEIPNHLKLRSLADQNMLNEAQHFSGMEGMSDGRFHKELCFYQSRAEIRDMKGEDPEYSEAPKRRKMDERHGELRRLLMSRPPFSGPFPSSASSSSTSCALCNAGVCIQSSAPAPRPTRRPRSPSVLS